MQRHQIDIDCPPAVVIEALNQLDQVDVNTAVEGRGLVTVRGGTGYVAGQGQGTRLRILDDAMPGGVAAIVDHLRACGYDVRHRVLSW